MRRARLAAAAVLALVAALPGAPARAQDAGAVRDPLVVVDEGFKLYQSDGETAFIAHFSAAIREARQADRLSADWGIVYAMLTDAVRNMQDNPAYALRLADEGLAVVAADPSDGSAEARALLQTSRAYALADLGRLSEAADAALLAAPRLRQMFDDAMADDLESYAAAWRGGRLTEFNTSAVTLADAVLVEAVAARNRSDYGTALAMATRAQLPEDTGLPLAEVRRVNLKAGGVIGIALFNLNRTDEALAALLDAAALVLEPGWRDGPARWRDPPVDDPEALRDLLLWLGRTANRLEDFALADRAFALLEPLIEPGRDRTTFLLNRAFTLWARGTAPAERQAVEALDTALAEALARDDAADAALLRWYSAERAADLAPDWASVDAAALVAATQAAVALAAPERRIDAEYLHSEAARLLVHTDALDDALRFSRAAFAARSARLAAAADNAIGLDGLRRATRAEAETLLLGLHRLDSASDAAACPDRPGVGCAIIRETGAHSTR
jgi:hypothetical protein